jgi:hypothetical protein
LFLFKSAKSGKNVSISPVGGAGSSGEPENKAFWSESGENLDARR